MRPENIQKVTAIFLGILVVFAVGFVLNVTQSVVLPLVVALLLSFVLNPIIKLLRRKLRFPIVLAITLVILMIFGFFYLLGLFFFTTTQAIIREFPKYELRFQEIFQDLVDRYLYRLDIEANLVTNFDWTGAIRDSILPVSGSFMNFIATVFIITIILIFLFLETDHFKAKLKAAFPAHTARGVGIVLEHISRETARYLGVKLFVSSLTGFLVWLTLSIIGLDFPLVLGITAFFLNFIPNIGSAVLVVVAILLGFIQFYPSVGSMLAVAISQISIQIAIGNLMDPKLQGQRLNLSPVVILFALIFWGWLWGIVGMFISVPLMVTIKIVCQNVPYLKPVSILMGTGRKRKRKKKKPGRRKTPMGTPVENE